MDENANVTIVDKIKNKLKFFDSHHRMEQFSVIFLFLVAVMAIIFVQGLQIHAENEKLHFSGRAMYTDESMFSLTSNMVTVENIYRNEDFTKSFILIKADNLDGRLSTDANDYQIILAAQGDVPFEGNPQGSIYIFGNTGYMGLYLVNSLGFNDAMYNVILHNSNIVATDIRPSENAQTIYELGNMCPIIANLHGSDAIIADFLNEDNPSVEDIYSELILKDKAHEIVVNLNSILLDMNNNMSMINASRRRLSNYNIVVPSLPTMIASDRISLSAEDTVNNPTEFTANMLNDLSYLITSDYNVTIDTSDTDAADKYADGDDLYLVTNYVFPGGFQFNYQDLSIHNGIIDKIMPQDMTYDIWLKSKLTEKNNFKADVDKRNNTTVTDWYYTSGEKYVYDSVYATPESKAINSEISKYNKLVSKLYDLKYDYQVSQLLSYVQLEYEAKSVSNMFSINSTDTTVKLYR